MSGFLAPNGKPSNLTSEQYKLVRTPAFKEWFGDWENNPTNSSKVVDENGEPLVVYHFTDKKFNIFDIKKAQRGLGGKGFYFTDDANAQDWGVRKYYGESKKEIEVFPYAVFLDIKNLKIGFGMYDENTNNFDNGSLAIFEIGKKKEKTFVVFQPNQIKLADGSNTTFDSNNPDIRFNDGGLIKTSKDENGNWSGTYSDMKFTLYNISEGWSFKIDFYSPIFQSEKTFFSDEDYEPFKTKKSAIFYMIEKMEGIKSDNENFIKKRQSKNPDIRFNGGGNVKKVKFIIDNDEEEERIKISIKDIGEVILSVTYPEYEFLEDIGEDGIEELGVEEGNIIGKIEHLEIDDKYKGKGYAKLLMEKAIEIAKEKGLMPLYLNASPMGSKQYGLNIYDLTGFYESLGFEVFLRQGGNNLMILKNTYKNGGLTKNNMENKIKFSKEENKDFNFWKQDGNVSKNPDGSYSTQDAQWTNNLKDLDALKQYYYKEFLSDRPRYAGGGSADDKHLIAKAIEFIIGSAIDTNSIEIEPTKISFKRKNTNVYTNLNKKLIEDTIRMHGKSLKGRFAKGGEAGFDDTNTSMVIYHEEKGNPMIPKNQIYLWLYEGENASEKLESGEYDFVMYPYASLSISGQKGFIPPLKKIWTKKFQKQNKGSEHLIGVIKAHLLNDGKELYIDMMSVNPSLKKHGIMSYMIKDLRDTYNLTQDQVTFSNLTDEGKKFVAKKTYADGGGVGEPMIIVTPRYSLQSNNTNRLEYNELIEYLDNHGWMYEKNNWSSNDMELPIINIFINQRKEKSSTTLSDLKLWLSLKNWDYINKYADGGGVEEYLQGKRPILTNKQGEKYVLQGFVTSGYYLIPYDGKKYWEHFSIPKNQWISEKDINWSDYNFSQEQFNQIKESHLKSEKEILSKYHSSFFDGGGVDVDLKDLKFDFTINKWGGFELGDGEYFTENLKLLFKGNPDFFIKTEAFKDYYETTFIPNPFIDLDTSGWDDEEQIKMFKYADTYRTTKLDVLNRIKKDNKIGIYNVIQNKKTNKIEIGDMAWYYLGLYDSSDNIISHTLPKKNKLYKELIELYNSNKSLLTKKEEKEEEKKQKKIAEEREYDDLMDWISDDNQYANGGWVLVDADTEKKLGEYKTESEARKMMYEYEGNSEILEKSKWDKLPPNPNRHSPAYNFADGGDTEQVYIEFLNKEKGFKKDTKYFNSYEEAVEWGKENFDKFNPDMIKYKYADGGDTNNDLQILLPKEKMIKLLKENKFKSFDSSKIEYIEYDTNTYNPFITNFRLTINCFPCIIIIDQISDNAYEVKIAKDDGNIAGIYKDSWEYIFEIPKLNYEEFEKGLKKVIKDKIIVLYNYVDFVKTFYFVGTIEEAEKFAKKNGFKNEYYKNEHYDSVKKKYTYTLDKKRGIRSFYREINNPSLSRFEPTKTYLWIGTDTKREIERSRLDNFNRSVSGGIKKLEKYVDGGDIPHEDKMFQLPLEMVVYVPSTQDVDKVISVDKMDKRVDEVKEYLASKFGGYTSSDKLGGYVDSTGNLVNEDVVQVTSFSTQEAYDENKEELINQLAKWGKQWGQEAIGFEFEGDLMYVPQELENETKVDEYRRGGFMYEVQKKGSPSNDMRETMFTAKNLTELKKQIIEKYGTSEGFIVSRRTEQGYYAPVKFKNGGAIYPDLSLQKADVVNDSVVLDEFQIKKTKNTFQINGLENLKITKSDDAVKILRELFEKDTISAYEQSIILYLNKNNKVIGYYNHSSGGIDGTVMDVEMISGLALKSLAKGVIVSHNHPSENTKPSDADIRITKQLNNALKLFNIDLVDSIILTENSHLSFQEQGLIY
jgi:GNAT superfamily N-acetyltransferase